VSRLLLWFFALVDLASAAAFAGMLRDSPGDSAAAALLGANLLSLIMYIAVLKR